MTQDTSHVYVGDLVRIKDDCIAYADNGDVVNVIGRVGVVTARAHDHILVMVENDGTHNPETPWNVYSFEVLLPMTIAYANPDGELPGGTA